MEEPELSSASLMSLPHKNTATTSPAKVIEARTAPWFKIFLAVFLSAAVVLVAIYFLTIGSVYLPWAKPTSFAGEKIEIRCYSPLMLPLETNSLEGMWARTKWKLLFPGQARLVAALKSPQGQARGLQGSFEALGYSFPDNCFVQSRHHPPDVWIAHYPSMLTRIESELRIKPHSVMPSQP